MQKHYNGVLARDLNTGKDIYRPGALQNIVYILYNKNLYLVTFQRRVTKKFQQLDIDDSKCPQDQLQPVIVLPSLSMRPDDRVIMYNAVNDSRGERG